MSNVAKLRRFKGMTQTDIAVMLDISLQAYFRKEKGYVNFTDKEKIFLKEFFSEEFPNITIDTIFFSQEVPKVEN
ncbi:helix-turn-helix domain-containing protein [Jeotgalibaca sp. MA1X17-3]|uniref:helix-turn-helix transcriptional regulator n=1 Tax=Jeotgalibaca sp. MA1X17-3 TaxID=2908211 RepID=UPI001F1872F2|nr:helix-turn-helix transcriptional regulator [Jeotgalibaca sp. MA1X17-3]UJF14996.1 helix-turn-helix domain-containing protein [Jeotgalibaca sp. MA1X17-3]